MGNALIKAGFTRTENAYDTSRFYTGTHPTRAHHRKRFIKKIKLSLIHTTRRTPIEGANHFTILASTLFTRLRTRNPLPILIDFILVNTRRFTGTLCAGNHCWIQTLASVASIYVEKHVSFFENFVVVITPVITRNIQTGNRAIRMTNTLATIVFFQRRKHIARLIYLLSIETIFGARGRRTMNLSRPKAFAFVA